MSEQMKNDEVVNEFLGVDVSAKEITCSYSRGEMIERAQRYCFKSAQKDNGDVNHIRFRLDFGMLVEFINQNFPRS